MSTDSVRFERMVNAYSGDLYRYALFLCREPAQAEDLVQETFLRAWRFLGSLREESKAKSWLMTTVRREFARQFERYRPKFEDADLELIAGSEGVDYETLGLRKAMMALPEKYRDVLLLQVVGGYNGEEMAGMLGIPRATVNTRLFRARAHLKAHLEGEMLNEAATGTNGRPAVGAGRSFRDGENVTSIASAKGASEAL